MKAVSPRIQIAVLDDYQNVALRMADWSVLDARASTTVFNDHLTETDAVVERLAPFDVVCVMRERTPLSREIIQRLPRLKLIASTAARNASIDMIAAAERNIVVAKTGYSSDPTVELTWALILAAARHIVAENHTLRTGGWQRSIGSDLAGRTLAILGLGNIGTRVANIGRAFQMNVIAWSQNMSIEQAQAAGATLVSKQDLFGRADFLTVHLVLSARSRGLVNAADLGLMKPTAWLINTSRAPIVDAAALIDTLGARKIAGAALDVFDEEPLPATHPYRSLENVLATPHIGYVAENLYRTFYGDTVANISAWLETQ